MPQTCKVFQVEEMRSPLYLRLLGDPKIKIESATHIIEFPGGAVEVSRCDDGSYWAHIIVNEKEKGEVISDTVGRVSSYGEIVHSRIDHNDQKDIQSIPDEETVMHIAILIRPVKKDKK